MCNCNYEETEALTTEERLDDLESLVSDLEMEIDWLTDEIISFKEEPNIKIVEKVIYTPWYPVPMPVYTPPTWIYSGPYCGPATSGFSQVVLCNNTTASGSNHLHVTSATTSGNCISGI